MFLQNPIRLPSHQHRKALLPCLLLMGWLLLPCLALAENSAEPPTTCDERYAVAKKITAKKNINYFYAREHSSSTVLVTIVHYKDSEVSFTQVVPKIVAGEWKYLNEWNNRTLTPFSKLYKGSSQEKEQRCKKVYKAVVHYIQNIYSNPLISYWDPFQPNNKKIINKPVISAIESSVGMFLVKENRVWRVEPLEQTPSNDPRRENIQLRLVYAPKKDGNLGSVMAKGQWIARVQRFNISQKEVYVASRSSHCENWAKRQYSYSYFPVALDIDGKQINAWQENKGFTPDRATQGMCVDRKINYKTCQVLSCNKRIERKAERVLVSNLEDAKRLVSHYIRKSSVKADAKETQNASLNSQIAEISKMCEQQKEALSEISGKLEKACQSGCSETTRKQINGLILSVMDISTRYDQCTLLLLDAQITVLEFGGEPNSASRAEIEKKLAQAKSLVDEAKANYQSQLYPYEKIWKSR